MKKFVVLLLALAVLLCGCTDKKSPSRLFLNDFAGESLPPESSSSSGTISLPDLEPPSSFPESSSESSSEPSSSSSTEPSPEPVGSYYDDIPSSPESFPSSTYTVSSPLGSRGTNLAVSNGGELRITRFSKTKTKTPSDGVWTIFVYMCGTDLESDYGAATSDLSEMIEATKKTSTLRFVIEAGGTAAWKNNYCADRKNTRLVISGGKVDTFSTNTANMGAAGTLAGFLDWGLSGYLSEYTALVLWDHGGGSVGKVCYDEVNKNDALTYKEIDSALAAVYEKHGVRLNLIGCDACLMATVEIANILAPYADYLVASQEVEPGYGWDYSAFSYGIEHGAKNGGQMGKAICDRYFNSLRGSDRSTATMSVISLYAIDDFLQSFNSYFITVYNRIVHSNSANSFIRSILEADRFSSPSYNRLDIRTMLEGDSSAAAAEALEKLERCVVYHKNGSTHRLAGGLSIYYPITPSSGDISELKDICISPYYLSTIDLSAYASSRKGSISGNGAGYWLSADSGYWSDTKINEHNYDYWYRNSDDDESVNIDTGNLAFTLKKGPHLEVVSFFGEEIEAYCIVYDPTEIDYVQMIYGEMYQLRRIEGQDLYLKLGHEITIPIDDGYVCAYLDGVWAALPNDQLLCGIVESEWEDEENHTLNFLFSSPIYLNGKLSNLIYVDTRSQNNIIESNYSVIGVTSAAESGSAPRIMPLKKGDKIAPAYPEYKKTSDSRLEFIGFYRGTESYTVPDSGLSIAKNVRLNDGNYLYSFMLKDIYGNIANTDPEQMFWE
ncbi:MAG: hypothetical protein J1F03_06150 [Oscillospiraceae bacterium]|nr:hypothetical protein [Oscillospiraceae bacterium]